MVTRLSGLASGMDIDSMVKGMLQADKIKVDKVSQNKQKLEWKKETYNDVNKELANFLLNARKDFGLIKTSSTGTNLNLGMSGIGWHKSASSTDETVATATISGSNSFSGTHTVDVIGLAKGVSVTSDTDIGLGTESLNYAGTFKINSGETITIELSDTLDTIANKINTSGSGVKASYDSTLDRFFLQTDGVGASSNIELSEMTGDAATFIDALKLDTDPSDPGSYANRLWSGNTSISGTDGSVSYNGITADITSNTFTFNGVSFTAKATGTATVTVATDVDTAMDKIKKFVENYNSMIENTSKPIAEKYNRSYQPLSEEQKEAMSDEEVELWEGKAKKGLLYRDDTISRMLTSMRSNLYNRVEETTGSYSHITEIGITTEKYSSGSTGGKLQIDETKLKAALSSDADGVLSLLFKESDTHGGTDDKNLTADEIAVKRSESGIFTRMSDELVSGMKEIINRAGTGDSSSLFRSVKSNMLIDFITGSNNLSKQGSISMIDSNMLKLDSEISKLNEWLYSRESAYYSRFTAMEKAMQNANNQSSWLMQQTGGY